MALVLKPPYVHSPIPCTVCWSRSDCFRSEEGGGAFVKKLQCQSFACWVTKPSNQAWQHDEIYMRTNRGKWRARRGKRGRDEGRYGCLWEPYTRNVDDMDDDNDGNDDDDDDDDDGDDDECVWLSQWWREVRRLGTGKRSE